MGGFQLSGRNVPGLFEPKLSSNLEETRKWTSFVDPVDMTEEYKSRGKQLFTMLTSWTQELTVASKIARDIRDQNGFEFWRLFVAGNGPRQSL